MIGRVAAFVLAFFLWVTAVAAVAGASVYFIAALALALPAFVLAVFLTLLFTITR